MKHSHYKKDVSHLSFIDPYRIAELYGIGGGPLEHAHKKILCAGTRGAKDKAKDVQEAIDSLLRWQEMQAEDLRGAVANTVDGFDAGEPWPEDRIDVIAQNGNCGTHYGHVRG